MRAWILVALLLLPATACGGHIKTGVARIDCGAAERGLLFSTDGRAPCEKLRSDIDWATDTGAAFRLWPAWQRWDQDAATQGGWHLQAVGANPLPIAWTNMPPDAPAIIGLTDLDEHEIMVTTGQGRQAFRSCLLHELLHVVRGSGHCHWAKLAPMFAVTGDQGGFYDECENVDCAYRWQPGVFTCVPRVP